MLIPTVFITDVAVLLRAQNGEVQLERSQKVLLRVPNGCESCT